MGADTCHPGVAEMMHFALDAGGVCENGVHEQVWTRSSFQEQFVHVYMKMIHYVFVRWQQARYKHCICQNRILACEILKIGSGKCSGITFWV